MASYTCSALDLIYWLGLVRVTLNCHTLTLQNLLHLSTMSSGPVSLLRPTLASAPGARYQITMSGPLATVKFQGPTLELVSTVREVHGLATQPPRSEARSAHFTGASVRVLGASKADIASTPLKGGEKRNLQQTPPSSKNMPNKP